MQIELTAHQKAELTYQLLKKRRAAKERRAQAMFIDVTSQSVKRCSRKKRGQF